MKALGYKSVLVIACLAILANLTSCAPQAGVAKDFMRTLFSGKARDSLVLLCVDGGVNAIVAVQADWSDDVYKVIYKNDQSVQVLVSGRLIVSAENLERYFPTIREVLLKQGYEVPELPSGPQVGAGVQFGVNFDNFHLKYDDLRKKWCVEGDSYYGLLKYLFEMTVNEISKLPQ